jgi:hypothetical protein
MDKATENPRLLMLAHNIFTHIYTLLDKATGNPRLYLLSSNFLTDLFRFASDCIYNSILMKVTELPFFASKVRLGRGGVEEILPLGPLNEFER